MATLKEIREKYKSQYYRGSDNNVASDTSLKSIREKYKSARNDNKYEYDTDEVNYWFTTAGQLVNGIAKTSKNPNYDFATNQTKIYNNYIKQLNDDSDYIKEYINSLKGTSQYDTLKKQFKQYKRAINNISTYTTNLSEFASQFDNEDDYNNAVLSVKYQGLKTYDDFMNARKSADSKQEKKWLKNRAYSSVTSVDELQDMRDRNEKRMEEIKNSPAEDISESKENDKKYEKLYNENERIDTQIRALNYAEKYQNLKTYDEYMNAIENVPDGEHKDEEVIWLQDKVYSALSVDELQAVYDRNEKEMEEIKNSPVKDISESKENDKKYDKLYKENEELYPQISFRKYYYELPEEDKEIVDKYLTNKNSDVVTTADGSYEYDVANTMSSGEVDKNKEEYNQLADKGYDLAELEKWYLRGKEKDNNAYKLQNIQKEANEHPVEMSIGTVFAQPFTAVASAVNKVGAWVDKQAGGDGYYDYTGDSQYQLTQIRNTVSNGIGNGFGSFLYNTGMSLADFAILLPLHSVPGGQTLSLSIMGTEAGTNMANEVLESGGDLGNAVASGVAAGIAEAFFEKFSIDQLKTFKLSGSSSCSDVVKNVLKGSFTEGTEEAFTDMANLVTDNIINGDMSQFSQARKNYIEQGYSDKEAEAKAWQDWGIQLAQSFAGGALSGGVMNAGVGGLNYTQNYGTGKLIKANNNASELIRIGKSFDVNTNAYKEAVKLDKKLSKKGKVSSAEIGQLRNTILQDGNNTIALEKKLNVERYVNSSNLTHYEKTIAQKFLQGESLTQNDVDTLNNSKKLQSVVQNLPEMDNATVENFAKAYLSTGLELPKLEVQDFKKIDTTDMSTNEALNEYAVAQNMNEQTRQSFIENYDGKMNVDEYALEFLHFNNLGKLIQDYNQIDHSKFSLNNEAKMSAYEQGLKTAKAHMQISNKLTEAQKQWQNENNGYTKGTVDTESIDYSKLNAEQKNSIKYASQYAKFGLNVKFVQTEADSEGVYTDPNGSYDPATNTITIDVNSTKVKVKDQIKRGAILYTLSHELTHVSENATEEYIELRKAVQQVIGNQEWNNLIKKHTETLRQKPDKYNSMTELERSEYASQEALAEACSDMLKESDILLKMAEDNPTVTKKLINFFKNVIEKIRKLLAKNSEVQAQEAHLLEEAADDLQSIVDKWEKAVIAGIKNQNAKMQSNEQKNNTADNSDVKNQARNNKPDYKFRKALTNEEWGSFYASVTESNQRDGLRIGDNGVLIPYENHPHDYKLVCYEGDSTNPCVTAVYKLLNYDYTIHDNKADVTKIIIRLEEEGYNDKHTRTILQNYTSLYGSLFEKYNRKSGKYIKLTRESVSNRENVEVKSDRTGIPENAGQGISDNEVADSIKYQSRTSDLDNKYLNAVNSGDVETAQKLVDEAAKENGYTIKAYHGTTNQQGKSTWNEKRKSYDTEYKRFTVFKKQYDEQAGHFFNDDIDNAGGYGSILYSVYLKINKPLVIDCNGQNYASITFDGKEMDTYEWADYAKKHHYDGVVFKNISDGVGYDDLSRLTNDYVVFNPNQIKSSEPITYDDKGNVIPLSKRFIDYSVDIRYQERGNAMSDSDLLENAEMKVNEAPDFSDFSFDDDFEDLFETEEKKIEFEKMVADSPELALQLVYKSSANTAKQVLNNSKDTKLSDIAYKRIANKVAKDYFIEPTQKAVIIENLRELTENCTEDNFSEQFEKFVLDCKDSLFYSNMADDEHEQRRQEIKSYLKGKTLLIPENEVAGIASHYESIRHYRNLLFFRQGLNVALETNAKQDINGQKNGVSIETLITDLQLQGELTGLDTIDGGDAYIALEEYLNKTLAPKYSNPFLDGQLENIEVASVEMAFDVMSEYTREVARQSTHGNNSKLVKKLRDTLKKTEAQRDGLIKAKKENYETYNQLQQYKKTFESLKSDNKALDELNKQIKEISFNKGTDRSQLPKLKEQKQKIENRIVRKYKALHKFETMGTIQTVLKAEKKKAVKKTQKKYAEMHKKSMFIAKIKKLQGKMTQRLVNPTDNAFVPKELINAYSNVCSVITDAINMKNGTKTSMALLELSATIKQLNEGSMNGASEDYIGEYSEIIKSIDDMSIYLKQVIGDKTIRRKELTLQEAKDIYNILKEVYGITVTATKQLLREDKVTNYESGEAIRADNEKLVDYKKSDFAAYVKTNVLNGIRTARYLTGYNDNSELMYHVNALNEGNRKTNYWAMNSEKLFTDYTEAHEKEYKSSTHDIVDIDGVKLTRMMGLQILMSWEREVKGQNLVHMRTGGITIPDAELLVKGRVAKAFDKTSIVKITPSFIVKVENSMTEFENGYRKIAEQYFNERAKQAINEVSNVLKHRDIATSDYYIPFAVDQNFVIKELDNLKYDSTLEGMGMLKSTVIKAKQPIIISGLDNVVKKHINDTSKLYGLAIPCRNFKKALNVKFDDGGSVRNSIQNIWGKKGNDFFNHLIADMESPRTAKNLDANTAINNTVKALRNAMVVKTLTANISVVIKQAASYPTAGAYLSGSSLSKAFVTKGIFRFGISKKGYAKTIAEIDKYTAQHYVRRQGLSTQEIAEMSNSQLNKLPTAINPTKWIQGVDCLTTAMLWEATKNDVNSKYRKSGKDIDTEEYWKDVTNLYDKVIEDTQPMYDVLHRTELQKSTNELWKTAFMFKTQPLQNTGIIYDSIGYAMQNKNSAEAKKNVVKAFSSQMTSLATFALMSFVAAAFLHKRDRYKDENDEVTFQSIISTILVDMLKNGIGVAMPLFGTEFADFIQNKGKYDAISNPVVDTINDTAISLSDAYNSIVTELDNVINGYRGFNGENFFTSLYKSGVQISGLFGIPTKNIENIIKGLYEHGNDIINGEFVSGYTQSQGGRSNKEYALSYGDFYNKGDYEKANSQLKTLYDEKYEYYKAEGYSITESKKKARGVVRDALSNAYKEEYQKAFVRNDTGKMQEISSILQRSGYMTWVDKTLSQVLSQWRINAKDDLAK